jgi:hypothetical protein
MSLLRSFPLIEIDGYKYFAPTELVCAYKYFAATGLVFFA